MSKKVTVAPALETLQLDLTLALGALTIATKAETAMEKAGDSFKKAVLALADAINVVLPGQAVAVLKATQRAKDANDVQKFAHAKLKDAYLVAKWGEPFCAWLASAGKPTDKRKPVGFTGEAQTREYWNQQKGDYWGKRFVTKALAILEAPGADEGGTPTRKANPIDAQCRDDLGKAIRRMRTAEKDAKDIPPHVSVAAFLALASLASDALETSKAKRDKAERALAILREAKVLI